MRGDANPNPNPNPNPNQVGTLLGGATRTRRQLRLALRALHLLMALTSAAVIALCWRVHADTHAPDGPQREAVHPVVYRATPPAPGHALRTVEHAGYARPDPNPDPDPETNPDPNPNPNPNPKPQPQPSP